MTRKTTGKQAADFDSRDETLIPVRSDADVRGLSTVDAYVADVEPKFTSTFIKFCQKNFPRCDKLSHLKKFRRITSEESTSIKLTAIITAASSVNLEDLESVIKEEGYQEDIKPYVLPLPEHSPRTRTQFEAWRKEWPMGFHEPADAPPKYNSDETALICQRMQTLLASVTNTSEECCNLVHIMTPAGALIGKGIDTCLATQHPLQHAALAAITDVSQSYVSSGKRKHPDEPIDPDSAYLCTGLDAYLDREPCVMCTMALLHSRIGRVFYLKPNSIAGALGTHYKLHCHSSLNHHFLVHTGSFSQPINEANQQKEELKNSS